MIRIGVPLSVEEFFKHLPTPEERLSFPIRRRTFFGESVDLASSRYRMYKEKGVKCVHCGREGTVFILERSQVRDISPHFNLYAVEENGKLILMTRDHIVPKSRGGKDEMSNYQPLCTKCNCKKGSRTEEELFAPKTMEACYG